jgi:threonyl-tRNA synthetase
VITPHIGRAQLWKTSGHLDFYKDAMYSPIKIDDEEYYLKPMNCPFHIDIYNSEVRSYRDLPMRLAEFGTVYRYELSGTLNGLTRVRGFTQDDAHIICTRNRLRMKSPMRSNSRCISCALSGSSASRLCLHAAGEEVYRQ